ncbi:hypothetical protein N2M06_06705 [Oceanimonas sp. AH20CE76]|uniref:hypothetical protein n=1 Tax=Oceanimonas sp. AH20CE76 TaxID=2977120 RepID=UPI0031FF0474
MFNFKVRDGEGHQAHIRIQALDWSEQGEVTFSADNDALAVILLSDCRSGRGHFELLSGAKPMDVEQWLDYLQEQGQLKEVEVTVHTPLEQGYGTLSGLDSEQVQELLQLVYKVGGFNRLQIMRYLKHRNNPSTMSTRYSAEELTRYRHLGELINYLLKLKTPDL